MQLPTIVLLLMLAGAKAGGGGGTNATSSAGDDCSGRKCREDWCGPATSEDPDACYCSKGCAAMDCSHGYNVNDDDHYCKMAPEERHATCMNECNKAASSDDLINDCKHGCGYWCDVTTTKSYWEYTFTPSVSTIHTLSHGTKKKHAESETEEWIKSITRTMSEGSEFEQVSVSSTISHSLAQTYADEWEVSAYESWTYHFKDADIGKAFWQFKLDHTDVCGHKETSLTQEGALTTSMDQKPCCLPGHASDAPHYQNCNPNTPNACKGEITV